MKISASNISVSRTNLSGDTFVGAGGVNSTTAASTYPSEWAWSANFAHSSDVATHVAGHGFNDTQNITTFVSGKGVQEDPEARSVMGANAERYGGGFSPASLPAGAVSGTLQDGATGPNGVIDTATDKYLTVYIEIVTMGSQPTSDFFNALYWGNDDSVDVYNGTPIPATKIVRKTGELKHKGTVKSSGTYAAGEFISVSYDLTAQDITEDGGSGNWADADTQCKHVGPMMGSWAKAEDDIEIIFHGYVLSQYYNNNEALASIDLPIAVS
jgi:hypothetical protein